MLGFKTSNRLFLPQETYSEVRSQSLNCEFLKL